MSQQLLPSLRRRSSSSCLRTVTSSCWQSGAGRDCYVTFPVLLPRLTCGSLRRGQQRVRHYRSPILRCTA
jgi:hypothetical protein